MAQTNRKALVALYDATDGDNWKNKTNWSSNAPLSHWDGVTANDQGRVLWLLLGDYNLQGIFQSFLRYGHLLLSCDVPDLSQEFFDRKWSFHEIASFTGSHNDTSLCSACGLRLRTAGM